MVISLGIMVVKSIIIVLFLLFAFAYATWLERRLLGRMQHRWGPNRAGPFGLLQPVADAIKMIFKEEIVPQQADKITYLLAPIAAIVPALMAFAVIPVGPPIHILGQEITLYLADVNIGLLYILAVASVGLYGIVLAGWSSGSKYSLLGGLRSCAQMISYELPLALSLLGVLTISGSLSLVDLVEAQRGLWNVVLQPLGFLLYLIAAVAEVNRLPFDLPEAEAELVAGFHTEYSSIKFAFFFMAEYINMIVVSSLAVTLFFGGWLGPFLPGVVWYFIKLFFSLFLFIWLRATLPRLRYDRLMQLGWKVLTPLAIFNLLATATFLVIKDLYL